jgi:hypothetical protein
VRIWDISFLLLQLYPSKEEERENMSTGKQPQKNNVTVTKEEKKQRRVGDDRSRLHHTKCFGLKRSFGE